MEFQIDAYMSRVKRKIENWREGESDNGVEKSSSADEGKCKMLFETKPATLILYRH